MPGVVPVYACPLPPPRGPSPCDELAPPLTLCVPPATDRSAPMLDAPPDVPATMVLFAGALSPAAAAPPVPFAPTVHVVDAPTVTSASAMLVFHRSPAPPPPPL